MSDFVNTVDSIGDEALINSIINRSITEIRDNYVTSIGAYALYGCSNLAAVDFPAAASIGDSAFQSCTNLATVDFPVVAKVGQYAFKDCSKLTAVNLPVATSIGMAAFQSCTALTSADFSAAVTNIGNTAFQTCTKLTALILRSSTVAIMSSATALNNTPIKYGTGYIYVPAALVDSYKAAENWSTYANQFRALEDYTVDGTTTGALDESKI